MQKLFPNLRECADYGNQHASHALHFAARTVIMNRGKITYDGASAALLEDTERLNSLLGVSAE